MDKMVIKEVSEFTVVDEKTAQSVNQNLLSRIMA